MVTSDFSHVFKVQGRKVNGFWNVTHLVKDLTIVHAQPSTWLEGCTASISLECLDGCFTHFLKNTLWLSRTFKSTASMAVIVGCGFHISKARGGSQVICSLAVTQGVHLSPLWTWQQQSVPCPTRSLGNAIHNRPLYWSWPVGIGSLKRLCFNWEPERWHFKVLSFVSCHAMDYLRVRSTPGGQRLMCCPFLGVTLGANVARAKVTENLSLSQGWKGWLWIH